MSGARLMQILASLARRSPLRTLHTICETQHQVSTQKLERYLETVGDRLKVCAFDVRMGYDTLATRLAESEAVIEQRNGELARLHARVAELEARQEQSPTAKKLIELVNKQEKVEHELREQVAKLRSDYDEAVSDAMDAARSSSDMQAQVARLEKESEDELVEWGTLRLDLAAAKAEMFRLEKDSAIGAVVWRFLDRMNDYCSVDPAETILDEFVIAIDAAIAGESK